MKRLFAAGALVLASLLPVAAQNAADPQNTILLDTKDGRVTIRLRPDLAPKHVQQIKTLTKQGFYNGVVFHRVIDGFMAQTGDRSSGWSGRHTGASGCTVRGSTASPHIRSGARGSRWRRRGRFRSAR